MNIFEEAPAAPVRPGLVCRGSNACPALTLSSWDVDKGEDSWTSRQSSAAAEIFPEDGGVAWQLLHQHSCCSQGTI